MDEAIDYIFLRFEESYYAKNPYLLGKDFCMKDENLFCNCITGIVFNYAGYVARKCLNDSDFDNYFEVGENTAYVRSLLKGDELCPVCWKGHQNFPMSDEVCSRNKEFEVYFPFRKYSSLEEIERKLNDNYYGQKVKNVRQRCSEDLWVLFLGAIRVKSFEVRCKALLIMAIFMFPDSTLKMIYKFLSSTTVKPEEKVFVKSIIDEYKVFLKRLEQGQQSGFFFRFSVEFEKMTDVNISNFIESIDNDKPDASLFQALWSAYRRNCDEMSRRSGYFRRIDKII